MRAIHVSSFLMQRFQTPQHAGSPAISSPENVVGEFADNNGPRKKDRAETIVVLYVGAMCQNLLVLYVSCRSPSHLTITFYEVDEYKVPSLSSLLRRLLSSNRLYRFVFPDDNDDEREHSFFLSHDSAYAQTGSVRI
jgi:hypothetical protein